MLDVFTAAADLIDAAGPGGAESVRTAAAAIDPSRPLLTQQYEVRGFFQAAADALREHAVAVERRRND